MTEMSQWPKRLSEKKTDWARTYNYCTKKALSANIGIRGGNPLCWNPTTIHKQLKAWPKHKVWFEANWKHAWSLIYLFGARTCILGSALHFIQITWFTYVFAENCFSGCPSGCSLQDAA